MAEIVLSFGSNLGDRQENILKAYNDLDILLGKRTKTSDFVQTKAWGFVSENLFVNSVAVYQTDLSPYESLQVIHKVESLLGRVRSGLSGYEDRLIDIDILFYDNSIIDTEDLTIPHPLLHLRDFVLVPLQQVLPEKFHPILKKKIKDF